MLVQLASVLNHKDKMYHEEKFINGILMHRSKPDGEWTVSKSLTASITNIVYSMRQEDREKLFSLFCTHCGSTNPRCQCWNDE